MDVLIDHRLVPLRVETLARVFGPPLVFSTVGVGVWVGVRSGCGGGGGTHTHHNADHRHAKKSRRLVGHHDPESTVYRSRAQCDSRVMNAMHVVWMVTMYGPTCMDDRVRCRDEGKKVHTDVHQVIWSHKNVDVLKQVNI